MTDDQLFQAFENGELDPAIFDHRMHLRMGWIYTSRFPRAEAISRFASRLKAWTITLGIKDKYHETITWFYMLLISERQSTVQARCFDDFINLNRDLLEQNRSLLEQYYSKELLASETARQLYLLPDRLLAA